MVRKLKKGTKRIEQTEMFQVENLNSSLNLNDVEQKELNFNIKKPKKDELGLGLDDAGTNKALNLDARFEIRISKLEKALIEELKIKGVNVSLELRKALIRLSEEVKETNFLKNQEKTLKFLNLELKKCILRYKQTFHDIKKLKQEKLIQEKINERYFYKYHIKKLEAKIKNMEELIELLKS